MSFKLQIVSLAVGLFFLFSIFYYLRGKKINPNYAVLWILFSLFLISVPIFQGFYRFISQDLFGFYAENLIYLTIIGFLLIYVLFITSKISRLNDQVKQLISFTAILEHMITKNNKRKDTE